MVDVKSNGAVIELRDGDCGGSKPAKHERTAPRGREIKRPPPVTNNQDEVVMLARNRKQVHLAVDVRITDTPADEEICDRTGAMHDEESGGAKDSTMASKRRKMGRQIEDTGHDLSGDPPPPQEPGYGKAPNAPGGSSRCEIYPEHQDGGS